MRRRFAGMLAVAGVLAGLGASSAFALDDDRGLTPSPGPPVIAQGVYGYDSTASSWVVWDLYSTGARKCHHADRPSERRWNC